MREAARMEANTNRVAYGRTKAEKAAAKTEADRRRRELDGAKREP